MQYFCDRLHKISDKILVKHINCHVQREKLVTFLDFRLSQGSVATYCRWGRNLCHIHIENFLTNHLVKVIIKHQVALVFFETQCISLWSVLWENINNKEIMLWNFRNRWQHYTVGRGSRFGVPVSTACLLLFFSEYRVTITDSVSDGDQTNKSLPGDPNKSGHSFSKVSVSCDLLLPPPRWRLYDHIRLSMLFCK